MTKRTHAAWLFTIITNKKDLLQKLREKELKPVKYIFEMINIQFLNFVKGKKFPNIDFIEDKYLACIENRSG